MLEHEVRLVLDRRPAASGGLLGLLALSPAFLRAEAGQVRATDLQAESQSGSTAMRLQANDRTDL
jgi:hypothetical protein